MPTQEPKTETALRVAVAGALEALPPATRAHDPKLFATIAGRIRRGGPYGDDDLHLRMARGLLHEIDPSVAHYAAGQEALALLGRLWAAIGACSR